MCLRQVQPDDNRRSSGFTPPYDDNGCTSPRFRCNFASSTSKKNRMKSTNTLQTLIVTGMFLVFTPALFAAAEGLSKEVTPLPISLGSPDLAPATPAEATFEEFMEVTVEVTGLAPVTPVEAEFETSAGEAILTTGFAPVTPLQADFE